MKTLEVALDADVFLRGNVLTLDGADQEVEMGRTVVSEITDLVRQGHDIAPGTIEAITGALEQHESPSRILEDVVWRHRNLKVAPKTVNQKRYVDAIRENTVTVGIGPAGTGKSFLAVAMAVAALSRREVNRIVLTRPAVEAGERLGFLPGDLMAKVDPYLRPLFDALYDMLEPEKVNQHLERGVIEVAPLAFMRGRTLNDSFIILDEAQNTSPEQMKMFLTRLGFNSKMVVTGDVTQIDLPTDQRSGLKIIGDILEGIEDIEFVRFGGEDVVRHKLVQRIVEAYNAYQQKKQAEQGFSSSSHHPEDDGDMRVLVVEDEPKMAGLVKRGLEEEGIAVDVAGRGEDAVWMAGSTEYDVVVLDVMLPGLDGFEVCRRLRADEVWTPVLMLTARDAVEDRVAGLDGGADDYLVKPFSFEELLARLRALARRGAAERPAVLEAGDLRLDPATRRASARRRRDRAVAEGVRAARDAHAPAGRRAVPAPAARARLGRHVREPLERDRRLHPLPAREDRPPVRDRHDRDGPRRRLPPARMSRIPIRIRLTLAFVLALGVVLAGLGWIVYTRFEDSLNDNTDRALRSRATDIAAVIDRSGPRIPARATSGSSRARRASPRSSTSDGRVVDGTQPRGHARRC